VPVVIELAPWLIALFLVAFFLAAKLVFTPMIVSILRHIPGVGRFLAGHADNAINSALNSAATWLKPHLARMVSWTKSLASATLEIPHALEHLAAKIEEALKYLALTKVPQLVHSVTNPIARAVNGLIHQVAAVPGQIAAAEERMRHGIEHGIRDLRDELTATFRNGIDRLRHDVFSDAIPGLEHSIANAFRTAEGDIARVGSDVNHIATHLADLAKRLDIPLSLLEQMIASVGVVVALQALESLARCEPKMRALCNYDPDTWGDFLLGVLAILAFPGFRSMVEMGADITGEIHDAIKELALS
jgi:hypothetical protein